MLLEGMWTMLGAQLIDVIGAERVVKARGDAKWVAAEGAIRTLDFMDRYR